MRRVILLCLLLTACATANVATQIERVVDEAVAAPIARGTLRTRPARRS